MDLDRLLHEARAEVPEGLAARLAAGARGAEARKVVFWADVERTAHRALTVAAAAAVLTIGLAISTIVTSREAPNAQRLSFVDLSSASLDPVESAAARLALGESGEDGP
jgi:hypothetical protein